MLKNQLFVVQKPFQWERVIQMDPRKPSKSSSIKTVAKEEFWKKVE